MERSIIVGDIFFITGILSTMIPPRMKNISGIGIRFRSNINNAKVPVIVYLTSFIFIAILRGNLGKSTYKT
jgi:hypothetical protein